MVSVNSRLKPFTIDLKPFSHLPWSFSLLEAILFWCFMRSETNFYDEVLSHLKDPVQSQVKAKNNIFGTVATGCIILPASCRKFNYSLLKMRLFLDPELCKNFAYYGCKSQKT